MRGMLLSVVGVVGVVGMLAWQPATAATLEDVVRLLAQPAQPTQTPGAAPGWARLDGLSGMVWQHAGVKRTPMGHTRHGMLQIDGLGKVTTFFNGNGAGPNAASLLLDKGIDKGQFNTSLRKLMPAVQIQSVRGGCKDDSDIGGSAVFQLQLAGARVAHIMLMSGTSKAGLETELAIAGPLPAAWRCPP